MPGEESFGLMDKAPPMPKKDKKEKPPAEEKKNEKVDLEVVTYYSTKKNQRIRIRPPIKQYVNGREFKQQGLAVTFADFQLRTRDAEVIEELDKLLYGEGATRWRRIFYRAPSSKAVKAMTSAAKKAKEVEKDALKKELGDEGIEELDNWNKFLENRKKKMANVHTGMRAVKMG